jgi:hypothetical protein
MQVQCGRCARAITLTDIIESSDGRLSHADCTRPNGLTAEERALIFLYCHDHAVARCLSCNVSLWFTELAADPLGGHTNLCPRCRHDLTEGVRAHLYRCTTLPTGIRLAAQAVRETTQRLVKRAHQAVDRADVLIREAEALLFASQKALRAAMERRTPPPK